MILILSAIEAYTTTITEIPELQPVDFNHDENYKDWKAGAAEAVYVIRLAYYPNVMDVVTGIPNAHEMWNTLETSLDTTISYVANKTFVASSMLVNQRRTNHFTHTSPTLESTEFKWSITTMQSPIKISACNYSHHCHLSIQ
jgi:hypothetical protein